MSEKESQPTQEKGVFKKWLGVITYTYTKPLKDTSDSLRRTKSNLAEIARRRREVLEHAKLHPMTYDELMVEPYERAVERAEDEYIASYRGRKGAAILCFIGCAIIAWGFVTLAAAILAQIYQHAPIRVYLVPGGYFAMGTVVALIGYIFQKSYKSEMKALVKDLKSRKDMTIEYRQKDMLKKRRTMLRIKRIMIAAFLIFLCSAFFLFAQGNAILAILCLSLTTFSLSQSFKYGLYCHQIRHERLMSATDYIKEAGILDVVSPFDDHE